MGGGSSSTMPAIPRELSGLYTELARQMRARMLDAPLTDFAEMDPRQFAGLTELEQQGQAAVQNLFGSTPQLEAANLYAQRLAAPPQWQGVDLGSLSPIGAVSFGPPAPGGRPSPGGRQPPGGVPPGGGAPPGGMPPPNGRPPGRLPPLVERPTGGV